MKPRITVLTLGVDDLERALAFYRDGLGFPTPGIVGQEFEHGAVVFIELENGMTLGLWERANMSWETGLPQTPGSPVDVAFGHNVNTPDEVDAVIAQAEAAGAKIVKPAQLTFWGSRNGYFQDPDGHLWEVAWNPAMVPAST